MSAQVRLVPSKPGISLRRRLSLPPPERRPRIANAERCAEQLGTGAATALVTLLAVAFVLARSAVKFVRKCTSG
jgi:hypothetical protein